MTTTDPRKRAAERDQHQQPVVDDTTRANAAGEYFTVESIRAGDVIIQQPTADLFINGELITGGVDLLNALKRVTAERDSLREGIRAWAVRLRGIQWNDEPVEEALNALASDRVPGAAAACESAMGLNAETIRCELDWDHDGWHKNTSAGTTWNTPSGRQ